MSTAPTRIAASTASRDGGATWQKVLFKGNDIGAIDVAFDPANSQTLYASLWNTRRPPWSIYPPSYGPGSGLYKSTDGGTTWQPLTRGLPTEGGRPHRHRGRRRPTASRVYAIVDAKEGGLFRSDDAGATFAKVSGDARIWGRGWYFGKVVVDPKNADLVYVSNTGVYRSRDGGKTFGEPFKGSPGGDDYHQLWISPDDSNRMILGGDQGAVISVDGLNEHPTWSSWLNQPTAQIYRVAADNSFPVLGDRRAAGQRRRPRALARAVRRHHDARLGAAVRRRRERLHRARSAASRDRVRRHRDTLQRRDRQDRERVAGSRSADAGAPHLDVPLVFSPADPHALYFSDQYLFKTTDGGEQLDADQRGHDAREPRRAAEPRRGDRRRRAASSRSASASSTRSRRRR